MWMMSGGMHYAGWLVKGHVVNNAHGTNLFRLAYQW